MNAAGNYDLTAIIRLNALAYREIDKMTFKEIGKMQGVSEGVARYRCIMAVEHISRHWTAESLSSCRSLIKLATNQRTPKCETTQSGTRGVEVRRKPRLFWPRSN